MLESSSEINWEKPPIYDDYPDDSHYYSYDVADVVQEQEDQLELVPIFHSPDVVQEQENHLAQVPIFHSPDVVQEQENHLAQLCPICYNAIGVVFCCGHQVCVECGDKCKTCPICRDRIHIRIRLFCRQ